MKPLLTLVLLVSPAFAGSKADPADWILWRAAPIAFPDSISPQVPELMRGEPLIDFTPDGTDLTIVMPDGLGDDYDSEALDWAKRHVIDKVTNARVALSSKVTAEHLKHHVLCRGEHKVSFGLGGDFGGQQNRRAVALKIRRLSVSRKAKQRTSLQPIQSS